jgi:hypothetical protein
LRVPVFDYIVVPTAITILAFIRSAMLPGPQVMHGELFLERIYKKKYSEYKRGTGRYFPKLPRRAGRP